MAKRPRRPKPEPLPVGDVYAMRLPDGRYGAIRVIGRPVVYESFYGQHVSIVAVTQYMADAAPTVDDPSLRRLMTHHYNGEAIALLMSGPVPSEFTRIGNIRPTPDEAKLDCRASSGWEYFAPCALREWRWIHDRSAWHAEREEIERQREALLAEHARREREKRATMTYTSFRKQPMFHDWGDTHPPKLAAAARKIMRDTATKLERLGKKPERQTARKILRDCIVAFNELDEANDHFIATIEREDIDEHFTQLATLAGFADEPDLADEWREF